MNKEPQLKTFSDFLAFMFSVVFSPYVTALVFVVIMVYNFSDSLEQFLPWVLTFFIFGVLIPGLYVLWQMESKKITDLHISNINERKVPFIVGGVSSLVGVIVLLFFSVSRPVMVMVLTYSINMIIMAIITQFWKISIHMALFSTLVTVSVILLSGNYAWLYLFLIPLGWSRLHRQRHTIWQAVGGAALAFAVTMVIFWGFGYI